jgi:hypothetical protein
MCAMPDVTPPPSSAGADGGAGRRSDSEATVPIGGAPAEPLGPVETEGPLTLQRYRKRDGRQLILFVRREREP